MIPLPFSPEIEQPDPDEQSAIDGIIHGMTEQSRIVERRDGAAGRASHAKSTACVVGTLTVQDNLAPELAQGLFASPGSYPAAIRFAQGPGERLGDRVSTHRGMAIKLFGVQGEKLPGHAAPTQDFVLATGTTFPSGTAKGFLRDGTVIGKATALPEAAKSAVAATARTFNRLLHALGTESARADFFGHPFSHPLAESYFSQAPIRFGDHVVKLASVPASPAQGALAEWRLDPREDQDGFGHAAMAFFAENEAIYEIKAQLWVDAEQQPIEDASVDWPVALSPYRTVATLRIPVQDAASAARRYYFDEVLTFRPAHSLVSHRPLGSTMRARLQVYAALSAFRHGATGVAEEEPDTIDLIPA